MKSDAKHKIILALDVESLAKAQQLVELLQGDVEAFKVGQQLFTGHGPSVVTMIQERGTKVFLDLKFHDIPNTVAKAVEEVVRLGVFMFNVHAMGGFEMMQRAVESSQAKAAELAKSPPILLAVTMLTSIEAKALPSLGISSSLEEQVLRLALMAQKAGLDGVVASAQEIEAIKKECGSDFLVVTPGIRFKLSPGDDQKRTLSPQEAIQQGSDYIIIGRPITQSSDPRRALKKVIQDIEHMSL